MRNIGPKLGSLKFALSPNNAIIAERLPREPFLTEEVVAPFSIPRPVGQIIPTVEVAEYIPKQHDVSKVNYTSSGQNQDIVSPTR